MSTFFSYLGRGLRGLWWLLDQSRRAILNLLLLGIVLALAWAALRPGLAPLQPKTALVLDLVGRISEQRAGTSRDALLQQLQGPGEEQTLLRDVLAALDAAAKDERITHAVLLTDRLGSTGLPVLREVAAALQRFKAAGKPVIAWGADYDQRGYYLAAHASEVALHPMGDVSLVGYGRLRSYYKDLFDRVGVDVRVVRVGKYKNAVETYTASGPSPETDEADKALYGALWASWTGGVEQARKLAAGSVAAAIDTLPASLTAVGGDGAKWALQRKWVDKLQTRDELRDALIARGAKDGKTFRQVSLGDYLGRIKLPTGGDAVGVIVAEGGISDGRAGPGAVGGLSTAELIRQARDDERIKAVVLRVNSPGGSPYGSELVRRELELTRKAGKPVVVSMGEVAASGGYWISMAADEVIADEATITGSIGVVGLLPSAQAALDKLGVHSAGRSTTWLGNASDPRRTPDARYIEYAQAGSDRVYRDFTTLVAAARKTTPEKIDAVGQGRVWAGKDALARGLVDRLGSYGDALQSAATRGKLAAGYRVEYIEAAPGRLDRLLRGFGMAGVAARLQAWAAPELPADARAALQAAALVGAGLPAHALAQISQDLEGLAELSRSGPPYAPVVHCLCVSP